MAEQEFNESNRTEPPVSSANRPSAATSSAVRLLRLWFGFREEVDRRSYAASGFGLMVLKYGVEVATLWLVNRAVFTPLDFLNPVLSAREELVRGAPQWLGWAWFFWTLPFIWVAVTMSVRRAANAGLSPWLGLLVLVPVVNLFTMLVLAAVPASDNARWTGSNETASAVHRVRSAVMGVGVGLLIALAMVVIGIYVFDVYGASIFLGTPILMGAAGSVVYNSAAPRSFFASVLLGALTVVIAGGVLLLFALEGVICLLMAAPIAIPLGGLGGAIGKAIAAATIRPAGGIYAAIAFLPLWAGAESVQMVVRECVVVSHVEIDAPADRVWKYVIDVPDLPAPEEWYYRLGIACPMRARIDGRGVGAQRQCVFTTGVFVEPITSWDEPHRLAFDVTDQPPPMFELSPYRHVHPPHLDGVLRSNRGEFRLVPLPGNRTRLEGRTWYELRMFPQAYWTLWSDVMIHRIHDRVLQHVKRVAEGPDDRDAGSSQPKREKKREGL